MRVCVLDNLRRLERVHPSTAARKKEGRAKWKIKGKDMLDRLQYSLDEVHEKDNL